MRNDKIFNSIVEGISKELNMDIKIVNNIIEHQFESVKKVISNSDPTPIKLSYLGKFNTNKKWYDKVKSKRLEKKNLVPVEQVIEIYSNE